MDSIETGIPITDATLPRPQPPQESEQPLPRPGRSLLWLILFAAAYMMAVILYFAGFGGYVGATNPELVNQPEQLSALIDAHAQGYMAFVGMYMVQALILIPLILTASHFTHQSWRETLAIRTFSFKSFGFWLLVFALFLALQTLAETVIDIAPDPFILLISNSKSFSLAFLMVVMAPLLEELLFRGYLFKAWRSTKLGLSGTLLLTSVLFAALHWAQYHWILVAVIFGFSILLGLAREKTGSLWVPIILHSLNNLVFTVLVIFNGIT